MQPKPQPLQLNCGATSWQFSCLQKTQCYGQTWMCLEAHYWGLCFSWKSTEVKVELTVDFIGTTHLFLMPKKMVWLAFSIWYHEYFREIPPWPSGHAYVGGQIRLCYYPSSLELWNSLWNNYQHMKKVICDLNPFNTVCSSLVSVQLCLSMWFPFCSIKFNHCCHFEILSCWLKAASTVSLSCLLLPSLE